MSYYVPYVIEQTGRGGERSYDKRQNNFPWHRS